MRYNTIEERYTDYLLEDDTVIDVDNMVYYKAVWVEKLNIRDKDVLIITLPWKMFEKNNVNGKVIINEYGNLFKLDGIEYIRFAGNIPRWYGECGRFVMVAPMDSDIKVGEYFALVQPENVVDNKA